MALDHVTESSFSIGAKGVSVSYIAVNDRDVPTFALTGENHYMDSLAGKLRQMNELRFSLYQWLSLSEALRRSVEDGIVWDAFDYAEPNGLICDPAGNPSDVFVVQSQVHNACEFSGL